MEIKSSLLNSKEMGLVKDSLIIASENDHEEQFRVDTLEYINDSADNNEDEFFYDMLEFVRFLKPNKTTTAYTTPEHLIYMNCPGIFGKKVRFWDFIYCHECLHQLWDTFAVGEKIKEEGIKYDHMILNIASDCVINDYLSYYRKKILPDGLITPEYLKENYNIEYNRNKDTQYTLYLKLLENKDELEKDDICQDQCGGDQQSNGEGQEQSSNNQSSKGQSDSQSNDKSPEEQAKDAAKEAQDAADKAKNSAGDDKNKQDAADKAQNAADKAKEEADKAKEASKNGDKDEAQEHANKAQDAAKEAQDAAKEVGVDINQSDKGDKSNEGGKGQGHGGSNEKSIESDIDLDQIKKNAEDIINKYREKLSGDLSQFINQCKSSQKLKESGLITGAQKGVSSWNQKLQQYTSAYVKNKVFKKQREFKRTYQKVKRGSGFIEYGQPIQRGKKIKDDKLLINIAFYIDRSGSMGGCIDDVFKASYIIANSLQKQFGKEKVVDKVSFKMFAFDEVMEEITWGKKVNARGGTMDFDKILKYIKEKTNNFMINIIITDAEFSINESSIEKFLKEIEGCVVFVTNSTYSEVKDIANKQQNKTKLFYVQADENFSIN